MNFRKPLLCALVALLASCTRSTPGELTIGVIASLNGAAGEQGKNWMRGAELAAQEVTARGIPVKLAVEDDQTETAKVVSAFTKLVEYDGARGIVGGTWDYLGEAAYPLAKRYKVPFITPTNPPEVLSDDAKTSGFVYSNSMTLAAVKDAMRRFFSSRHARRVGIVYPNLPFGSRQAALVKELSAELGFDVVYDGEFQFGASVADNMKLAALKLKEAAPDAVFGVLDYNHIDLLTNEFKKMSFFPAVLTTQHLDVAFEFSKDPARYAAMFAIYPEVKDAGFENRFEARFGEKPRVFAAHGYDAVMFLAESIHAGVDFADQTAGFAVEGITGTHVLPAADRALVKNRARIMTTKNGRFEEDS